MTSVSGSSHSSRWPTLLNEQDITALAQSLRPIDTGLMKPGDDRAGQRLWYQGGEPYFDVVLELAAGEAAQIDWCQFTLRGKVLLWQRQPARLQTGETEELDVPPMLAYYAASKAIRDGASLDTSFVALVRQICLARPDQPWLHQMGEILASCKGQL